MEKDNALPLLYRLAPHDPAGHRYRITLSIAAPSPDGQRLSLPAWIPGSYLIRDFSRQIESLTAHSGTRRVPVDKIDNHTWQAAPCEGPLRVEYEVYAWDLSVRGAHLDETHGFFNGTSVFLRVHGKDHLPCLIDLAPPRSIPDWKVYTSLPEARGHKGAARRHGFGLYLAPDYDALIDHPVEMGTPQVSRFVAHGAEHELVFTYYGYEDDDEEMTRLRLKHANLLGPAGFVSMDDSEMLNQVQIGVTGYPEERGIIEMGGRDTEPADYMVTEVLIRSFYDYYRNAMGL